MQLGRSSGCCIFALSEAPHGHHGFNGTLHSVNIVSSIVCEVQFDRLFCRWWQNSHPYIEIGLRVGHT